ncbi:hypothetical protein ASZ78_000472 [Callipepla squamata]|uniref:Uncharacterized protein n=1 Tax=Callipepla squamata TaxID=9009 RepID=A0A226NLI7_CALSU|nr:hypothetical protein ASZ78_000472 [Callipepla squamata]
MEAITESAPLRCRKLSNPDILSSTGKTKLHRQLSQDDCKLRRGSLASSLSGKQLLPLSNSVHSGVGQTIWQPPGDTSNLVRMRNQSLGQSAPSLTAGLCVCIAVVTRSLTEEGSQQRLNAEHWCGVIDDECISMLKYVSEDFGG